MTAKKRKPSPTRILRSGKKKRKVLFVCVGNACRSPMAEAIARRDARDVIEPSSAGLLPLGFLPELTTQTLIKNGCSPDGLTSKPISDDMWDSADLVINLSGSPKERTFEDPDKVEDWDVDDPYGADPRVYQTIFEEIATRVQRLAEQLRRGPRSRAGAP